MLKNNTQGHRKMYWPLLAMLIPVLLLQIPSVSASALTGATIEVHPSSGDITTEIFVHVRGEPYVIHPQPFLYLYWDSKMIIKRLPAIYHDAGVASWWEQAWDVVFSPPNEYPYSELGVHNITAVIETNDGGLESSTLTFKIERYIPPPEWWDDLPQDFLDTITGPQGPQGPKGDTGAYPVEAMLLTISLASIAVVMSLIALVKAYRSLL